jgi:hypothetical protein
LTRNVSPTSVGRARVVRLADVDPQHALDQGEGDQTVAQ